MEFFKAGKEAILYKTTDNETIKIFVVPTIVSNNFSRTMSWVERMAKTYSDAYSQGQDVLKISDVGSITGGNLPDFPKAYLKFFKSTHPNADFSIKDLVFPYIKKEFKQGLVLSDNYLFSFSILDKMKIFHQDLIEAKFQILDNRPSNYLLAKSNKKIYMTDEGALIKWIYGTDKSHNSRPGFKYPQTFFEEKLINLVDDVAYWLTPVAKEK